MLLRELVLSFCRSSHTRFDCPAEGINNRMV
jgi:hypothetical protein